jgi:hypothetical protein
MGPPEVNCGWNSLDAGNTYNYMSLPGLQYISFNPNVSGLALGRTADSRVFLSQDGGVSWGQINATRAAWAPQPIKEGSNLGNFYMIKNYVLGYSEDYGKTFQTIYDNMIELHTTSNFVYSTAVSHHFSSCFP